MSSIGFQRRSSAEMRPGLPICIVTPSPGLQYCAMNFTKSIGMLLLAIYLIVVGIVTLTGLGIGYLTGVLALLAGIFIIIGR